ncbi:SUKH-3 domain-containing protein [Nocardiopsis sp. YSL2]|uniref:SUKH-3 domain-containing protein n=1 Tax=Nocardiopsis sp. YSL2 TaxID=2939492 RepID=UPI0026F466D4|nr:SUKH-3 domain-containing protein [Nocardiopsis sp. YSL2]
MLNITRINRDTLMAMEDAGWHPGRLLEGAQSWYDELRSKGYPENQTALDFLGELGGLAIEPIPNKEARFGNHEALNIDPFSADAMGISFFDEMSSLVGEPCFPVGEWLSYSSVFLTASGRMMAGGLGYVWLLGGSPEEGVQQAVMADRDLLCIHTDEGLSPWP